MKCKCNTTAYDPNCHIGHTNSVRQAEMAFPRKVDPDSELLARSDVALIVSPDGPVIIVKDRYGGTTANGQVTGDGQVYVFIRNEIG